MGEIADMEIDNILLHDGWDWENDRHADAQMNTQWRKRGLNGAPNGLFSDLDIGGPFSRLPKRWQTKDGIVLLISDMAISHLRNTKAMIERCASNIEGYYNMMAMFDDTAHPDEYSDAAWLLQHSLTYKAICKELARKTSARDKEWPIFAPKVPKRRHP